MFTRMNRRLAVAIVLEGQLSRVHRLVADDAHDVEGLLRDRQTLLHQRSNVLVEILPVPPSRLLKKAVASAWEA